MTRYIPRSYQPAISDFIVANKRPYVAASMGVGKSPATLQAISTLLLFGEVKRVLILAPKRVAQTTWPGEIKNFFGTFGHMRVAAAVGTEKERRAAIASDAEIVTANYEVVEWLVENYGATWPFDMVVCDESTKLKSLRVSLQTSKSGKQFITGQGGKRAKALARVALTKATRFVCLSGTPAPNGLIDLWGQYWFLDTGRRLGASFTAFSHRWFRALPGSDPQKQQLEPLPYADDQIRAAIKDITIAIEAKDHFDLPPLIENVIRIELPAGARKMYQQMEKEMFAELQTATIEAFNAGAMTQKCLAEGAEVLTDRGWIAIEYIANTDKVWDGVEWVTCDGVVCNGRRHVIDCWGVKMTADHLVLTTHGWVEAGKVIQNAVPDKEFDRPAVRLPDDYRPSTFRARGRQVARGVESPLRLRHRSDRSRGQSSVENSRTAEVLRLSPQRDAVVGVGYARDEQTPGVRAVARRDPTVYERKRTRLGELWSSRHPYVRSVAALIQKLLGRHGGHLPTGLAVGSSEQRRAVCSGKLQVGHSRGAGQQSSHQRLRGNTAWADDGRTSRATLWLESGDVETANATQLACGSAIPDTNTEETFVYDIVNCGPRHRFTVRGRNGEIFIAHNCLQIASGAAYVDDKGNWELVHDGKIDALGSVVEEAAGMPVLVFYHFKSDLARILKAFPKAVHLGADPKTIDRWNKGEIPMLVAHPQSAGHGLSLQHGSNIMCFFSSSWSLEADAQAIERAGPTRQVQSGYKRSVFVHRLVAAGTLEEVVVKRLKSKASVQDALMEAMKNSR